MERRTDRKKRSAIIRGYNDTMCRCSFALGAIAATTAFAFAFDDFRTIRTFKRKGSCNFAHNHHLGLWRSLAWYAASVALSVQKQLNGYPTMRGWKATCRVAEHEVCASRLHGSRHFSLSPLSRFFNGPLTASRLLSTSFARQECHVNQGCRCRAAVARGQKLEILRNV